MQHCLKIHMSDLPSEHLRPLLLGVHSSQVLRRQEIPFCQVLAQLLVLSPVLRLALQG